MGTLERSETSVTEGDRKLIIQSFSSGIQTFFKVLVQCSSIQYSPKLDTKECMHCNRLLVPYSVSCVNHLGNPNVRVQSIWLFAIGCEKTMPTEKRVMKLQQCYTSL